MSAPCGDNTPVWTNLGSPNASALDTSARLATVTGSCPIVRNMPATATLLVSDHHPPYWEYAVVCFFLATVALLMAMQFGFMALRHHPVPSDRLSWVPEATVSEAALRNERWTQALDMTSARIYGKRLGLLYDVGLIAFIGGLAVLLVPARWDVARTLSFGIAALGGLVELAWIVGGRLLPDFPLTTWLQPRYKEIANKVEGPGSAAWDSVLSADRTVRPSG